MTAALQSAIFGSDKQALTAMTYFLSSLRSFCVGPAAHACSEGIQTPHFLYVQDVLLWLRRKGYRINLRALAERQTLWWIGIIILVVWGFCWLCSLISGISGGDSASDEIQLERLEAQRRYMSSHPSAYRFDARNPSTFYATQEHDNL